MSIKERLHRLVDQLPESEAPAAERFLQYLRDLGADPVLRALTNAPEDDEPLTDEDREAIREGQEDVTAGRTYTTAEARKALRGER